MKLFDKLWLLVSQAVNCLAFNGDPDESLSARRYRESNPEAIDRWIGQGHCKGVYDLAKQRAQAKFNL